MELKIDKKWKWAAKDENGRWYVHNSPVTRHTGHWNSGNEVTDLSDLIDNSCFPECDWRDSLHQIIDGKLVKFVELNVDDKVMVRNNGSNKWWPRYFKRFTEDGRIVVFADGQDSWASDHGDSFWPQWRLPTVGELGRSNK